MIHLRREVNCAARAAAYLHPRRPGRVAYTFLYLPHVYSPVGVSKFDQIRRHLPYVWFQVIGHHTIPSRLQGFGILYAEWKTVIQVFHLQTWVRGVPVEAVIRQRLLGSNGVQRNSTIVAEFPDADYSILASHTFTSTLSPHLDLVATGDSLLHPRFVQLVS